MTKTAAIIVSAVVLVLAGSQDAFGQARNAGKTIWDGVYTEAQATRGQKAAQQNCGACHSPTEWSTSMFIRSWAGRSVSELHTRIRSTMPMDSPGRLTPQQYADIVAYMLKLNKVPSGKTELPSDADGLNKIAVTASSSK